MSRSFSASFLRSKPGVGTIAGPGGRPRAASEAEVAAGHFLGLFFIQESQDGG